MSTVTLRYELIRFLAAGTGVCELGHGKGRGRYDGPVHLCEIDRQEDLVPIGQAQRRDRNYGLYSRR